MMESNGYFMKPEALESFQVALAQTGMLPDQQYERGVIHHYSTSHGHQAIQLHNPLSVSGIVYDYPPDMIEATLSQGA